jgi:hypothetical protein
LGPGGTVVEHLTHNLKIEGSNVALASEERKIKKKWRHNTQPNDIQHNDIQHNDIQHNDIQQDDIHA